MNTLNPNALAFLALCNEYCAAAENARETDRSEFVATMLRLLPRLYIAATNLRTSDEESMEQPEDIYLTPILEEEYYDSVRLGIENLMGPDDTYLEVFEEDMKYSDTPIAASVAEGLTDIFQSLYNLLENIKSAPDHVTLSSLIAAKEDFEGYWSRILCNVMRALNNIKYSPATDI